MKAATSSAVEAEFSDLFDILTSQRFLRMEGTGNEVPMFIKPYAIETEAKVRSEISALVSRLRNQGLNVLEIDLLDFVAEILAPRDRLKRLLEKEKSYTKSKLLDTMRRFTDPKSALVPAISERFQEADYDVTIIQGVGAVFPFLRTHSMLENLQPAMMHHPVVMFFPGEYHHREGAGSALHLFGRIEHRGYYRAFNLDHYHL
jgi:hypothetical protein